jgi:putative two-component system response regulator
MAQGERLLFIDDSRSQLQLYEAQMEDLYEVTLAGSYEEAMADLTARKPDLIVLDMVMPRVNGLEFLDILKGSESFRRIPVIMVSGENDPQIVRQAFLKGAADFVRKPYDAEELQLRVRRHLQPHGDEQDASTQQFVSARSLMIKALADLAGTRDNETGFHLQRVEKYTDLLARAAAGRAEFKECTRGSFLETIGEVSVLHDIGKVGIPDAILQKPGRLTEDEFKVMKTHTTIGAATIRHVQDQFPAFGFLAMAHEIALHHHEKWDGSGYPAGLKGDAIPLTARLVALVDTFDALTTQRVYKAALDLPTALAIMTADRGKHFDPVLFDVFLETLPQFSKVLGELGDRS